MAYFYKLISEELNISLKQVEKTISLIQDGNTIPFIARYRKDVTNNLDEVFIKAIKDKFEYFTELESRKETVLSTIENAGKLTPELEEKIKNTVDRTVLEDIYLPFKPRKLTKAQKAREKGLEPLADIIIQAKEFNGDVKSIALKFVDEEKGVNTFEEALEGAEHIIAEKIYEDVDLKKYIRDYVFRNGSFKSSLKRGVDGTEKTKFENYYEFAEKIKSVPSHRVLAILRGENEKILSVDIDIDDAFMENHIENLYNRESRNIFFNNISNSVKDSFKRLIRPAMLSEVKKSLKEKADIEAVSVFSKNLSSVLMASPLGEKNVLSVDPGIRTGAKLAVLSSTGDFLKGDVLYWQSKREFEREKITDMIHEYSVEYIAIGNGTGSREVEEYIENILIENNIDGISIVIVNESGASIYSASDVAREEFPELDLTLRGAISIGRRLQDPLSELVKIEAKSIGVGQYQHDVDQNLLKKELDEVVESCVNKVGVNINTASHTLLRYVAGINIKTARNIVEYREKNGVFKKRDIIKKVAGIGPKAYEQAAGFMRVIGANPLDNTGVHPDHYYVVKDMCKNLGVDIEHAIKNPDIFDKLELKQFVDNKTGLFTLKDIIEELKKPGRDPREKFVKVEFDKNIHDISDLKIGLVLNGKITNITKFGAFCDIGVHQDGLIHISQITDRFIKSPEEVLSVGQIVKVKVTEIDVKRRRISLSMRSISR